MNSLAKTLTASALALLPAALIAQTYTITDLSAGSPFLETLPYGISQNGLITGVGVDPVTQEIHAFIYNGGVFQDLGDLGYPYGADGVAINSAGQLAATGYGPGYRALRYSNGHASPIGSIDGGSSEGLSINSSGDIVGRAVNGDGGGQGFSYIGGHFTALSVDRAACINDSDQYIGSLGYSWVQNNYVHVVEHPFLYSNGTMTDLGSIGGGVRTNGEAYSLNNYGEVTGYSTAADGTIHAFFYNYGFLYDLGTFAPYYTRGRSINNHGQIIGSIETYVGGPIGTFYWGKGGMKNLQDMLDATGASWSALQATQINDAGWIVGTGTINGESHGFLARPKRPVPIMGGGW